MILLASTFWIKTFELLLALSILVVFHEFGHYFFARVFGVWVEKFYMFFNYKLTLLKWKPGKYLKWFSTGSQKRKQVFMACHRVWHRLDSPWRLLCHLGHD